MDNDGLRELGRLSEQYETRHPGPAGAGVVADTLGRPDTSFEIPNGRRLSPSPGPSLTAYPCPRLAQAVHLSYRPELVRCEDRGTVVI